MNIGDILVCTRFCDPLGLNKFPLRSVVIPGNQYKVLNIEDSGNNNIYISSDLISTSAQIVSAGNNNILGSGVSICFSPTKDPDITKPYSSKYVYDYFISLSESREEKLNKILN